MYFFSGYKTAMKRFFRTFLVLSLLVGQLALIDHVYDEHDSEQLCEVCLTLNQHGNAVLSSLPGVPVQPQQQVVVTDIQQANLASPITHFSARAPPIFL